LSIFKIEANIAIIDEHYIISGATCLVNCNGIRNVMGLIHKSKALCHKYNIRFLSANVFVRIFMYIIKTFHHNHFAQAFIFKILSFILGYASLYLFREQTFKYNGRNNGIK